MLNKILKVLFGCFLVFILIVIVSPHIQVRNTSSDVDNLLPDINSEIMTFGDKSLIHPASGDFRSPKKLGINQIKVGDYNAALKTLNQYLEEKPNDPEARIFVNNLEAIISSKENIYTVAVPIPINRLQKKSLEVLRGVAQAQHDFNNTRLQKQTKLVVVIVKDDDEDQDIVENVAKEILGKINILGVVGHYTSDASIIARKIYRDQLVSISPTSTAVRLTAPDERSPFFFRTVPNDRAAAVKLARYANNQANSQNSTPRAVVVYNSDSDYSRSLRTEFINELGRSNIVLEEDEDCDLVSWQDTPKNWDEVATRLLSKARREKANVLMLAPSSIHLEQALKLVELQEPGEFTVLAGDSAYSAQVTLKQERDNTEGMIVAVAWHVDTYSVNSFFRKGAKKMWGTSDVSWRTVCAYDAVQVLAKSIEVQDKPTRKDIQKKLSSPNFSTDGAFEKVKFEESSGDYVGDVQLVKVRRHNNGALDFFPV